MSEYKDGRGDYYLAAGLRESRCNLWFGDGDDDYCRRDKDHDGEHSHTRVNADEDATLREADR